MFYVVDSTPNRLRLYRLMLPVLWRLALVAGILLFLLASPPVVALIASPAEQQEQDQRQRALLKDAARQRDEVSRSVSLPLPSAPSSTEPAGPCFTVHTLRVDGAGVLDAKAQTGLFSPYRGTCMGLAHINTLIRDISQWYLSHGFVTSRAFLPEQDLAGGILTVGVLEGRIEAIVVNGQPDRITQTLFPGLVGEVLNLRDLEQGVDQLSRLSSLSYQLDIQPGTVPGKSIVDLKGGRGLPVQGSLEFDNRGQQSTGEEQGRVSLVIDSPLSLAELWSLSASRSTDGRMGM